MYARIIKHIFFPSAISSSCPIYLSGFLLHTGTVYIQTLTEMGERIFKRLKKRKTYMLQQFKISIRKKPLK